MDEKSSLAIEKLNAFKSKFEMLIDEGKDLCNYLDFLNMYQESRTMEYYLLNRMQNYLDGMEAFKFEDVEEALNEIINGEEE